MKCMNLRIFIKSSVTRNSSLSLLILITAVPANAKSELKFQDLKFKFPSKLKTCVKSVSFISVEKVEP